MQIRPTTHIQTSSSINLQSQNTTNSKGASNTVPVDQLDISAEAQMMSSVGSGEIRADRVADLRAQIATGQYDTAEKLDYAVSRMFDEYA